MVASRENQGGAGRGGPGPLPRSSGVVRRGRAGWDGWCGLPVTPGVLGMRSR